MHKTQVVLEDWQYEALQTLAEQEHRSISDLVREMLTQHLVGNHEIARQRLAAMEGIGADAHASGARPRRLFVSHTVMALMAHAFVDTSAWFAYVNRLDADHTAHPQPVSDVSGAARHVQLHLR